VTAAVQGISLPLEREAAVNVWLLLGEPLALVDTGPPSDAARAALDAGLAAAGVRVEDIELVLVTHQHPDHSGLADELRRRSGARVGAHEALADYLPRFREHIEAERTFFARLLVEHGVPDRLAGGDAGYWHWLDASARAYACDARLREGEVVRAGGRELRVLHRPGHSELDTLFVDDANGCIFGGDHLLATPAYAELAPGRERPLARYLENLRRLAGEEVAVVHTGHGADVPDHRAAVGARLEVAERRCARIVAELRECPRTAYELAVSLFRVERVEHDPVLAVSDVLGHLELLAERGGVTYDHDTAIHWRST
jgi:glyoxylase-like metal-dependent hydrolase (beta-lactamase superfamily II)